MFISLVRPKNVPISRVKTKTAIMVLKAVQFTAFFEGASQMAIPHGTKVQLQSEYMIDPSDLVDFTEETMTMISRNLRRPGGKIQDPHLNAAPGATTSTPPFTL